MKTSPCNVHPLATHFYIVKLGFTGVYISEAVLTSTHNICFRAKIRKNLKIFHLKIIIFTAVKNRCMLHGHVFVMICVLTK